MPYEFTPWHWAGFIVAILFFLALDLGVFHRKAEVVSVRASLMWTVLWFLLAMGFAGVLAAWRGSEDTLEFLAGYVVEYSLSLDNVFAMAVIFTFFGVAAAQQHRVLFWGIVGALIMRGLMIGVGTQLLQKFHLLFYVMGAFLLWTGIKWGFSEQEMVQPDKNPVVRIARKFFPVTQNFEGEKFFSRVNGRRALTPLALALLVVEATDLIFAVDSIPAIFAVTQDAFIVFTSNMCAILGLRSLYFVLAGAMNQFHYLKTGLAIVLAFVGTKMLISHWLHISTGISLLVVAGVIGGAILISLAAARGKNGAPTGAS